MRGTDLAAAEQLETLGEDVLELADRAPLQQHVPVCARGLLGLLLRLDADRGQRLGAASRTLPQRWYVCLDGHRHLEAVTLRAGVLDLLSRSELDPPLVFETLAPETGTP